MDTQDLKKAGLSATLPRLKILELFEQNAKRHFSAEDIFKILIKNDENVGIATVYRVLNQFSDAGIINRLNLDKNKSGQTIFELNRGDHHDHMYCVRCGRIEEFFDESIESKQETIASKAGWIINDHSMVMFGMCPDCKN